MIMMAQTINFLIYPLPDHYVRRANPTLSVLTILKFDGIYYIQFSFYDYVFCKTIQAVFHRQIKISSSQHKIMILI
jgi:hypothetical protein